MATPNMDLVEIVPGVTAGPQYATDIVSNFSTIDTHDHTTGAGVKVPVAGMNINGDLPFGGNGATGLGKSQYNSLGATLSGSGNYRSVHVVSGELYYLDGSGNAVQLTSSGSVAGSSGNITGLSSPASVTFSTNKYIFKDTATSFAIMESSDIRLFEDSASAITNYVAIKSPASLASTYTLTMPTALPAAQRYMASSSGGALSFETADTIGSAMTSTGANAIANTRTRATGTTVAVGGVAVSSSSGSFSTTSTSLVDVTNLSVTITTSGRPVRIMLIGDNSTDESSIRIDGDPAGGGVGISSTIRCNRDATLVDEYNAGCNDNTTATGTGYFIKLAPSIICFIDFPTAGTYDYEIQTNVVAANQTSRFNRCRLLAYEL